MAYTPQQYNMNKNRIENHNNSPETNINDSNYGSNNRRVQFSMYAQNNDTTSTTSIKSIPNANPLTAQESMPYRPELDQYSNSNQSPPKLSHNIKSIEINNNKNKNIRNGTSNNSTPESITEPIPSNHSEYDSKSLNNLMNIGNYSQQSLLVNPQVLVNEASRQISSDNDNDNDEKNNKLPLTNFKANSVKIEHNNHHQNHNSNNIQNSSEFDIFRQHTMPAAHTTYNSQQSNNSLPGLYSTQSQTETETNNTPPLPNAKSIVVNEEKNKEIINELGNVTNLKFNKSIPAKNIYMKTSNKRKVSLNKDFSNNKQAFETWMACCDIQDDTFGYYSALYPLLCEIFAENTKCLRVPKQSDLEEVILKHGAKKMKINKLHTMNNLSHLSGTISSDIINKLPKDNTDNDSKHMATISTTTKQISHTISFDKPKYLVTIKYKSFYKFWKWFEECCKIIKELSHLWDANNQSALQCNLFCGREESQQILQQAPQGTFMLRLSSVIKGGIVLSYCEPSFNKKKIKFKHTILIRRNINQYELKGKNVKKNNNNQKYKTTSIDNLIRSFVKIKFLYTPANLYPKKSIF